MNISVDGGGVCLSQDKQFGNFTFSDNLFKAIEQYDHENNYSIYTFDNSYSDTHNETSEHIQFKKLSPKKCWMKVRVSLEEWFNPKDIFLAVNQALPVYTSAKIITFSHGLSFLSYPHLYKHAHAKLIRQYKDYIKRSEWIVVSSQRVKEELVIHNPQIADHVVVMPFGIPYTFHEYHEQEREPFFLFSGMNHAIKNIPFIIETFKTFIQDTQHKDFKLYLIGPHQQYASENIVVIPHVNHHNLQQYYQKATAYLTASLYESFNFPVLEALSQRCPVIGLNSAIIPEMQPYSYVAKDAKEFLEYMHYVVEKQHTIINHAQLESEFSWEEYVKKLIQLYNV